MIPENIRTLRKALGLSMAEFADRVGVSISVVKNLEYDKIQNTEAKMPLFRLIAKEFGVPLEWILNGGPLELPDRSEAAQEAQRMGELIKSKDPAVKAFLEFWSRLTKSEREALSRQIIAYAKLLEENLNAE